MGLDVGIGCVAEEFSRTVCEDCGEGREGDDGYQKTMHNFKKLCLGDMFGVETNVFRLFHEFIFH